MDWNECGREMLAKKIKPDLWLATSLQEAAERKSKSAALLALNEITADSVFVLHYDSIRELMEALSIRKGFKIYNHECYAAFLDSIMGEKELAEEFNSLRQMRNAINYYGQGISLNEAKQLIASLQEMYCKIKALLENLKAELKK